MNLSQQIRQRWQAWWPELAPREKRLVIGAALLIVLALLWWVALAPALRTLRTAPAEHARLDAQLQQMSALQAQARALQAQPRAHREEALRALESSARQALGTAAQLQPSGNDAVGISVRGASADALGDWFAQARANARAVPREVHLTRSQATSAASVNAPPRMPVSPPGGMPTIASSVASGNATVRPPVTAAAAAPVDSTPRIQWDGTLVLSLPAQ